MTALTLLLAATLALQAPPVARPAPPPPRPGAPPTVQPAPPPTVGAQATVDRGPSEALLGVPVYPGAQFISSYDAGRNQRFYVYGTTASFTDLVAFYRTVLKQKGELIFDAPATHQFDVGRFREDLQAFPPGVTIKDFQSQISHGYPNPRPGGVPARFPSVIQIVPVTEQ
jgi:hypothetical protein